MSNFIELNELQSFYFEMQRQLVNKNKEFEEAISAIQKMESSAEEFSQFYKEGHITEIEYAKVRKKIKGVCTYYEGRLEKLNKLIPDIEDYINEYEKEYGISKI
jgi:GTP1/Obg family GTP-binding protein